MVTKNELREAVSESLLDALAVAEEKQQQEKYSAKAIAGALVQILQVILLPVLAYLLLQSVNVQKDIVGLRKDVAVVTEHLKEHDVNSEINRQKSSLLHHTAIVNPCTSCHTLTGLKPNVRVPK